MIQMTYDMQVDALAIQLREAGPGTQIRNREVAPGVNLDFDTAGHILALEVLDASYHLPRKTLEALPSGVQYLTITEAAKESGLSTETIRGQINKGRIPAIKRGRDWLIEATALLNYLESRDTRETRGRTAAKPRPQVPKRRTAKGKTTRHAA